MSARADIPSSISVGIVDNNMPYSSFKDGNASGFSVDVLRKIGENADLELQFQAGNWSEIYSAFLNGDIDVIDSISYRQSRAEKILFTEPYHIRQTYLMHHPDNPLGDINSLDDLEGKRIGVFSEIFYKDALTQPDITLKTYESTGGLIRALAFGWVDGIVGPKLTLQYYAHQAGFPFLKIAGQAPLGELAIEDFRLGVHKGRVKLRDRLQQALEAIPEEHIAKLLQRWRDYGGASVNGSNGFQLSEPLSRYVSRLGPVRVGFMQDYSPFSFRDAGTLQGLSVDLMNRIADLTGLRIIPVSGQWSELYPALVDGNIDVMANMSRTEERDKFARFSKAYHVIPNVAFTLDNTLSFDRWEDLRGYRVAIGAGIYYEKAIRDALGDQVLSFTSQRAMFEALADGTVDVTLAALPNGNHWIRMLNIPSVSIAGEISVDGTQGEDLRFGVRDDLAPVAQIIDQGLNAISPTEMNTIKNRWLGASKTEPQASGTVTFEPQEQRWLAKHNHALTLCLDPDWMPLEGINATGEHVGISADIVQLFREKSDIAFKPLETESWSESMIAAKNRECDLFPMAMPTPEREKFLNFTDPYLQLPSVMVGRIDTPFITSPDELGNQPIGIVRDYAFVELLRSRNPSINLVEVENESHGLRKVQERELAAYITTLDTANKTMEELGLADLKVIGRVSADWSMGVATRNDEPILLEIMQKLVDSLTDEELKTIRQKWSRVELKQSVDYTLMIQIALAAIVLLTLLFYWNRKLGRLNAELADANATLARLSVTDDLTQLGNRSYFDREFTTSFRWCKRHRAGFAVAMIDADHFKVINDNFGHQAGDECLRMLADRMRAHFRRDTDRLSRFGGEEFAVFSSYDDKAELIQRFEQLRQDIAEQTVPWDDQNIQFTISIGVATGIPRNGYSQAEFLRLADQALYSAKQSGRNRVEARVVGE
ncbi:transporter substrate-binding domain-containing protein [Marinobacter sp. CHS3-4]|uniref:transporter substrate-binding domain-containing diguanylate cyclase n=1 Tax=Marinobacter sp. CHS3-4 TaxID=3045174 RepID=UPI0024B4D138|nr:transporter substrate-binding domain-containing protein [Marinobacter sp. CHS3-4]MDI9244002.1 transporter substrate-binding domain-containing protein [Marinobacter sp. CHS3-4]